MQNAPRSCRVLFVIRPCSSGALQQEISSQYDLHVQAYTSKARVESFSLTADLMYVAQNALRICRALFEICLHRCLFWHSQRHLLLQPVQAYVSKARVESFSLTADLMYVAQNAPRICRALFEICLRRGWPQVAELALSLCKVRTSAMSLAAEPSYCQCCHVLHTVPDMLRSWLQRAELALMCKAHGFPGWRHITELAELGKPDLCVQTSGT